MFRKTAIAGFVLLAFGAAALAWVYNEHRAQRLEQEGRQTRLRNELNQLDELVGDEIDVSTLDTLTYADDNGLSWEETQEIEERRGLVLIAGGVLTLSGGGLLMMLVLSGACRIIVGGIGGSVKKLRGTDGDDEEAKPAEAEAATTPVKATGKKAQKRGQEAQKKGREAQKKGREAQKKGREAQKKGQEAQKKGQEAQKKAEPSPAKPKVQSFKSNFGRSSDSESAKQSDGKAKESKEKPKAKSIAHEQMVAKSRKITEQAKAASQKEQVTKVQNWQSEASDTKSKESAGSMTAKSDAKGNAEDDAKVSDESKMSVLLADAESVELEEPVKVTVEGLGGEASSAVESEKKAEDGESAVEESEKKRRLEDSFKSRTEDLEKRMSEFKRLASKKDAKESSGQVESSLRELTQQMSAIREYASHQQERVKKLQDGYDWNIIKNFCLRVIRCIDNLDMRMERLAKNSVDTADLEEVRDELIFALESTGVEQFEPELNSDYRGQEKNSEAVKEKEKCEDRKMVGKIAKIVRAGYHYAIDEDNFKVVRAAQVKLYG